MGTTSWSDDNYRDRVETRRKTGVSAFEYTDSVMASTPHSERKTHDSLSPHGVKFRESRDSEEHPNSKAVAVLFDVTGSMQNIPRVLQKKLPALMGLILRKGYLDDPAILFGGIGDATCDRSPLQIGQFESGIEMDEDLGKLYLEGGGGGGITESYELAMYFMANHTSIDCIEKRKERGYLFTIGDEIPYNSVKKHEVEEFLGETLQEDIPTRQIVAELTDKYEYYHIIPLHASKGSDPKVKEAWTDLLGQNVLMLDNPDLVCETIASTIGLCEGVVDFDRAMSDLEEITGDESVVSSVKNALVPMAAGGSLKASTVSGELESSSEDSVKEL